MGGAWYSHHWFNGHALEHGRHFQNAMQQFDLSTVAPEPAHVDRLEVIMAVHMVRDSLTMPAVTKSNRHIMHHLFHEDKSVSIAIYKAK
jgi:hypothetical protein